jgi:hypothetical protein
LILDWALYFDTKPLFEEFGPEPKEPSEKLVWKAFHYEPAETILHHVLGFRGGHFIQIHI